MNNKVVGEALKQSLSQVEDLLKAGIGLSRRVLNTDGTNSIAIQAVSDGSRYGWDYQKQKKNATPSLNLDSVREYADSRYDN